MAQLLTNRISQLQKRMIQEGINVVLLSVGADLPYFTGYQAMPLERLTMLVVDQVGTPTLYVPKLEAPRVQIIDDVFTLYAWDENQNPIDLIVKQLLASNNPSDLSVAIGDRLWSLFLLEFLKLLPGATWSHAKTLTAPLRSIKDPLEITTLTKAAQAADLVAQQLQQGKIALVGKTEKEVSQAIGIQLREFGHEKVNFSIVAAGANAASPHHEPTDRIIEKNEVVLCDFGGTVLDPDGIPYCSDITRCVFTGSDIPKKLQDVYGILSQAHQAAIEHIAPGVTCASIDEKARSVIEENDFGHYFIHRTGHGIGVEEHEDPYIAENNGDVVVKGNAFSIEPGIYIPGAFGFRLEDIVIVSDEGVNVLNQASRVLHTIS